MQVELRSQLRWKCTMESRVANEVELADTYGLPYIPMASICCPLLITVCNTAPSG